MKAPSEAAAYWTQVAGALGYTILPTSIYYARLSLSAMGGFWLGLLLSLAVFRGFCRGRIT